MQENRINQNCIYPAELEMCIETHKQAYEEWPHGKVTEWTVNGAQGSDYTVRYESGALYHYKIHRSVSIEWW
jgi:hypothetical protein